MTKWPELLVHSFELKHSNTSVKFSRNLWNVANRFVPIPCYMCPLPDAVTIAVNCQKNPEGPLLIAGCDWRRDVTWNIRVSKSFCARDAQARVGIGSIGERHFATSSSLGVFILLLKNDNEALRAVCKHGSETSRWALFAPILFFLWR